MLDGEPKPTFEQIEDLKSDSDAVNVTAKLTDTAIKYHSFLDNINNQEKLYGNAYDDALIKLAIIGGDEANRLSKVIGQQKVGMEVQFDALRKLPSNQLRFATNIINYDKTHRQHLSDIHDAELQSDIRNAMGDLATNQGRLVDKLPAGKIKLYNSNTYKGYKDNENKLAEYLRSQGYSDEVTYGAIKQLTNLRGGDLTYSDSLETQGKFYNRGKLTPAEHNTLQSDRTQYALYNTIYHELTPEMKESVRAKDRGENYNPFDADEEKEKWKEYEDKVNAAYNLFGQNANVDKDSGRPLGGHWIQTYQRLLNTDLDLLNYIRDSRINKGTKPKDNFWKNVDIPDGLGTSLEFLKYGGGLELYNTNMKNKGKLKNLNEIRIEREDDGSKWTSFFSSESSEQTDDGWMGQLSSSLFEGLTPEEYEWLFRTNKENKSIRAERAKQLNIGGGGTGE
jgi:hypothetical protein